jgi:putative ABC transport system permease protein
MSDLGTTRRARQARRLYVLLLRAYPASFRQQHGAEAADTFAELHADTRGGRARLSLWCRTIVSVVRGGLVERFERAAVRRPPRATARAALIRAGRDVLFGLRLWRRTPLHAGVAMMLVAAAVVMTRSMTMALSSAGAQPESILHYRLRPSRAGYDAALAARYQREVLDRAGAVAGVTNVALAAVGPDRGWCCPVEVSRTGADAGLSVRIDNNHVTPAFFDVLKIPIVAGRAFRDGDTASTPPVAIVSQALADRLWPDTNPIGRFLRAENRDYEVVGIAGDVHPSRPGEGPVPYVYFAYWQLRAVDARLFVAYRGAAGSISRRVRDVLSEAGPDVHVGQIGTLAERVMLAHASQRALMELLRSAALAALVLCALGVYGQLSTAVSLRRREHAIRSALGASAGQVRSGVIVDGLRIVAMGLAAGVPGSWAAGRLLAGQVYGASAMDPRVLALAAVVVLAIGMAAVIVPARRAAAADPTTVLRTD